MRDAAFAHVGAEAAEAVGLICDDLVRPAADVLVAGMPKLRAAMHLDTVLTFAASTGQCARLRQFPLARGVCRTGQVLHWL